MTTYTLRNGLAVYRSSDSEDSAVSVDNTGITLELVVPESTTSLSYTVLPLEPGDVPGDGDEVVDISVNDYTVRINGRTVNDTDFSPEFSIFEVDWMDGAVARTSTVLIPRLEYVSGPGLGLVDADYSTIWSGFMLFEINGAPLPPITTASDWNAFESSVTGVSVPTGAYGPGTAIPLTSLGAAVTENDVITGTGAPESLFGGLGDDVIDGAGGDDYIEGNDGTDTLHGGAGSDTLDGGAGGLDAAVFDFSLAEAAFRFEGNTLFVANAGAEDTLLNIERLQFTDQTVTVSSLLPSETVTGDATSETLTTGGGDDVVDGGGGDDTIDGGGGDDRLIGGLGDDTIDGGDGADTLNGGDGADTLTGGVSVDDLRDIIYGGDGDDIIDGGYGNDLIYGMGGNDTIAGGFGVDELQGQDGDDVITGSAFSDLVFGGDGNDFVNGGFGSDRINGGTGADKFFHLGVLNHGSDWVQDYLSADGDVLLFGQTGATADQFQVNYAHTANAAGERAGDDAVQEAFVIYKPTGQIMWALIDGEGQDAINLQIAAASDVFDLA